MKQLIFIISLTLGTLTPISVFAKKDYSERLQKDLVRIEAGKYVSTDYEYAKFSDGNTLQIKVAASCPVEVMSRDNFISLYSTVATMMMLATFGLMGKEIPDLKELDKPIGDPDIIYNMVMTKNGIQIQIITSEGKQNVTMKWDEIFE